MRLAPIACVDAALAFWFGVAVLASLRLVDSARFGDYILAGSLVGVCAAVKYPGASVAIAVA